QGPSGSRGPARMLPKTFRTIATYIVYDIVTQCFGHEPLSGAMRFSEKPNDRLHWLRMEAARHFPAPRKREWPLSPCGLAKEKETFGEYRRKKRRQPPVTVASLRLFLRSSTGPNRRFQPQSLGRVRDPVRIAEGRTAIDAATQRRHFGFRLRLVDNLQPIGGARQRPRREDGKCRVFALHTAQTRPTPR